VLHAIFSIDLSELVIMIYTIFARVFALPYVIP